jgi:uncharacterized protein (TIGR03067 family)
MFVTAMDRAGNESEPSNVVVVEHNGKQEAEYIKAKRWAEQRARNDSALKFLSGTWVGTDSAATETAGAGKAVLVVDRNGMNFHFPDGSETDYMVMVAHEDPKQLDFIDVVLGNGDHVGKKLLGVYRLDGDALRVCFGPPDGERPQRLERDRRTTLLTFVRVTTP